MALVAASCVRSNDERRPTMDEVVEELKVLSKAVRDSNKAWNGPCSAVATERTLLKSKPIHEAKLVREGTPVVGSKKPPLPAKILETKELVKLEKDSSGITEVKLVEEESHAVGIKSPPLPLKTLGPLMSARRKEVFLDERAKSGRNLMEFLARPEGEVIEFSTERVLRISSDRCSSGTVRPQNSDGRPHVRGVI
ncbi:uncharacterized protein A4U43_C07F17780 [Asparagus officinalis]|uniref:Uncharacterized protein n=2 Tax=Asparagus officinalis TaxID=4686 RepID=A0A5P1EHZ2_ASPOF|nr:uncharacterized protein A4U43_C07F17780 [Asparagus officinalis]